MSQTSPATNGNEQKLRKFLTDLSQGIMLTLLLPMLVSLYWLWWPYNPVTIKKIQVAEPEIVTGTRLVVRMDYCKPKSFGDDIVAQVQYAFHDDVGYGLLGQSSSWLLPGCGSTAEVIPVPMLPPGAYHLEMTRTYQVNLIRTIVVRAESNQFRVVLDCCSSK